MTARIMLTGALGQLGWEVTRRAAAAGYACHTSDRDTLDITDLDAVSAVVAEWKPTIIVNAAAYTAVDKAESDQAVAAAVNAVGPKNLAHAANAAGIPVIHVSTDYVFDGTKTTPYVETDPVAPLGVYGVTKREGEDMVRAECARHVILRTAWVYGIHGNNFVKTMLRLGADRDTLRVVDDQKGCPTFAADLADTILTLTKRLTDGDFPADGFGTFHCTNAGATTWCRFARKIFELAAPRLAKIPTVDAITTADYPTPAHRPANSVLDCGRLATVHGITMRSWEAALAEMLDGLYAAS